LPNTIGDSIIIIDGPSCISFSTIWSSNATATCHSLSVLGYTSTFPFLSPLLQRWRTYWFSLALWCIGWFLCLPLKHCFQAHLIFLATQKPLQKRSSLLCNHVIFFHNRIIMHAKFTKQGIWRSFTVLKITNWLAYRLLFVYTWVDSHNFEWYLFHSLTLNQGFAASKLLQEVVV
jgi:hypothetical protein